MWIIVLENFSSDDTWSNKFYKDKIKKKYEINNTVSCNGHILNNTTHIKHNDLNILGTASQKKKM